jgi:hypothetical protein
MSDQQNLHTSFVIVCTTIIALIVLIVFMLASYWCLRNEIMVKFI